MLDSIRHSSKTLTRTAPLFPVAAGMILGVVLDQWLAVSSLVYLAVMVILSVAAYFRSARKWTGPWVILCVSLCVGGLLHSARVRTVPPSSIERYVVENPNSVAGGRRIARVRGRVASQPRVLERRQQPFERWTFGAKRTAFLLEVESIEGLDGELAATGLLRVRVDEVILDLQENERVEVFGWLYSPAPPRNPGAFDWAGFNRRQGIVATMRCKHRENVKRLEPEVQPQGGGRLTRVRTIARHMLTDDFPVGAQEEASLLEAMVLGQRSRLDRRLNDVFIRAGCIHFLAVSGLHLAIPMSFVWWVGRRLTLSKRQCALLMLGTILVYVTIAEPRPPILRAGVMGTLFSVAMMVGRFRAGFNWLGAAGIFLVICSPAIVFGVGFQLSFVAVGGIFYLPPSLREGARAARRLYERAILKRHFGDSDRELSDALARRSMGWPRTSWRLRRTFKRWIVLPLIVAISAWLACTPIVATHFGRVHIWSAASTLVLFPLVYLLVILAFAKIAVVAVWPGGGSVLTGAITQLDRWLIHLAEQFGALPGATWSVSSPPWWWVVAWYGFLLLAVLCFRSKVAVFDEKSETFSFRAPPRSKWQSGLCAAALGWLLICSIAWIWPRGATGRLVMTVLSAGAGSATVIELPDGGVVLYDAGSLSPYDVGRGAVVPFLRHRGITRVDRLYISHPNLDHFSGVPSILQEIETGPIVVNEHFIPGSTPNTPSRHLLDLLDRADHPVEILDPSSPRWEIGGVAFEMLSPSDGLAGKIAANDTSTVLRLTYGHHSVLLTGDIEEHAQRILIERGGLHSDVLILPHHGGIESNSKAFFDTVGARMVIRSSHQPRTDTLNGLYESVAPAAMYNTADVGAVRITIDRSTIVVSTMRASPAASAYHPPTY